MTRRTHYHTVSSYPHCQTPAPRIHHGCVNRYLTVERYSTAKMVSLSLQIGLNFGFIKIFSKKIGKKITTNESVYR